MFGDNEWRIQLTMLTHNVIICSSRILRDQTLKAAEDGHSERNV